MLVGIPRAYLDASCGKAGDTYLVVSGLLAWPSDWDRAEKQWRKTLSIYGAKNFHTTDIRSGKAKPFRDWSERKKATFEELLLRLIARTAKAAVAVTVSITDYAALDTDTLKRLGGSPYRLAATRALHEFTQLLDEARRRESIAYIFEHGDTDLPGFVQSMQGMAVASEEFKRRLRIHSIKPMTKADAKVFDMPDLLAWEIMRHIPKSRGQSSKPMSQSLQFLHDRIPWRTPFFDREELERVASRNTPEYLASLRAELGLS